MIAGLKSLVNETRLDDTYANTALDRPFVLSRIPAARGRGQVAAGGQHGTPAIACEHWQARPVLLHTESIAR